MTENWRPIEGYEHEYEVSDMGRVRTLAHVVLRSNGIPQTIKARARKIVMSNRNRAVVCLCVDDVREMKQVHELVLTAFVGAKPEGLIYGCHRDDDPMNNSVINLYWGTPSQNTADCIANGNHNMASKTSCVRGHAFTESNTKVTTRTDGRVKRECRECLDRHNRVRREVTAAQRQLLNL